mmetsp:Transcript_33343/g.58480  ORF Transcript_33343/g.58480 Transcript_33343/m.58480 type:complete len:339 (-) Transcript_33343:48-1064(-)
MSWNRFCHLKLKEREEALLELMGVPYTRVRAKYGEDDYVAAIEVGQGFPIVLIHGYGGGAGIFYRVMKLLADRFRLISIDLPGMGMSSRPYFETGDETEAENFFIKPIEALMSQLGLTRFFLWGHSFGGYIAGCYACAHPEQIESLVLVSAVGVASEPLLDTLSNKKYSSSWLLKGFFNLMVFLWENGVVSPGKLVSCTGPASKMFLFQYMNRLLQHEDEETRKRFVKYIEMINLLPPSGELALPVLFKPGVWAKRPLSRRLKDLEAPILFVNGGTDWVTSDGGIETAKLSPHIVQVTVIDNGGHHLYLENPAELITVLLEFIDNFTEPDTCEGLPQP